MSPVSKTQAMLRQTRPWLNFIAIVGLVMGGLMIVGGLTATIASIVSRQPQMAAFAVVYSLAAVLYFFPCLFFPR
jgi:hypothetical protein